MDPAYLIDISLILAGLAYYLIYRFVFHKALKWKMIHAVWIPLIYAIAVSVFVFSLLQTPWFGANRTLASAFFTLIEVNLPDLACFILLGLTALFEK